MSGPSVKPINNALLSAVMNDTCEYYPQSLHGMFSRKSVGNCLPGIWSQPNYSCRSLARRSLDSHIRSLLSMSAAHEVDVSPLYRFSSHQQLWGWRTFSSRGRDAGRSHHPHLLHWGQFHPQGYHPQSTFQLLRTLGYRFWWAVKENLHDYDDALI